MDHTRSPKSALVDRSKVPQKVENDNSGKERSIHVKFAKTAAKSIESSMASVVPTLKPPKTAPRQSTAKDPASVRGQSGTTAKGNTGNSSGATTKKGKSDSVAPPRPAKTMTKPQTRGASQGSSRSPHAKPKYAKNRTGLVNSVEVTPRVQRKASVETTASVAVEETGEKLPQEKDAKIAIGKRKSKKSLRTIKAKSLPKLSKSVRKVKSKISKLGKKSDETEKDLPDIKVDTEYVSELTKITKILREVSAFDATTATIGGTVEGSISPRVKMYNHTAEGSSTLSETTLKRPLSNGELKQILSSITRVVSLHQLPVDGQVETSQTQQEDAGSGSSSVLKAKRKKRKKAKSTSATDTKTELDKGKPKTPSKGASKSKDFLRSSRSRRKFESIKEKTRKLAESQASSPSSTERDHPTKNAAFLQKYIEETNRLEGKVTSEEGAEVLPGEEAPAPLPDENVSDVMNQARAKSPIAAQPGSKKTAALNAPRVKANSQVGAQLKDYKSSPNSGLDPLPKTLTNKLGGDEMRIMRSQEQVLRKLDTEIPEHSRKNKVSPKARGKEKPDNLSTKAVAGSLTKANEQQAAEATNSEGKAARNSGRRTTIVDPTGRKAARLAQLSNLEGVINSKFKGNTSKMKSMWEKAPTLPNTESDNQSSTEQDSVTHRRIQEQRNSYFDTTPWSVTEKLIAETPMTRPYSPRPKTGLSNTYDKLRSEFASGVRRDERQIRRRYGDMQEEHGMPARPQTQAGVFRKAPSPLDSLQTKSIDETLKFLSRLVEK